MPPKEERLMKAMKWIIPALFLGLGMLGLYFHFTHGGLRLYKLVLLYGRNEKTE